MGTVTDDVIMTNDLQICANQVGIRILSSPLAITLLSNHLPVCFHDRNMHT
jgi:hypothetical protein